MQDKIIGFFACIFYLIALIPLTVCMVFYHVTAKGYQFFDEISRAWEEHRWGTALLGTFGCALAIVILLDGLVLHSFLIVSMSVPPFIKRGCSGKQPGKMFFAWKNLGDGILSKKPNRVEFI